MSKSSKGARQAQRTRHDVDLDRIWDKFDPRTLADILDMPEASFPSMFGLETVKVNQRAPADWYAFRDNGSKILAVAHLDTVAKPDTRMARFTQTEAGPVVHSRGLDDRLGAYTILDMLPQLGVETDLLLTVGEEDGRSTAQFFEAPKEYDWVIEFDRGGTDVVMYQYDDAEVRGMVRASGADVGDGSFSDISFLEHLEVKAFNWGIGYREYHGPRAHAYLDDTFEMVGYFLEFHREWAGTPMPHYITKPSYGSGRYQWGDIHLDDIEDDRERAYQREMAELEELAIITEMADDWDDDYDGTRYDRRGYDYYDRSMN
jgi:hypothetical protein